ncbi:YafY family protein, partial [Deinococcus sp. 6GRE01]|uniref:helix-turn-helix transcriptional regulator n=1 Tax=Deinococcus sp. 6GRE01 TaxID=2745873 RepID=UPI001E3013AD
LEDSLQMEPSPWVVRTDAPLLAALLRAVRDTRRVAFRYAAPDSPPTARQADVYRVVHLDGRWYAAAHCHLRGALRSFRLDRMSGLEICAQTFTPPADFDAGAFLRATHAPAAFDVSVWLDCPPGDLRGRVSAWGAQRLAAFLLGLDCPFRVDSPPQLQDEFRRLAGRCAAQLAYTGA